MPLYDVAATKVWHAAHIRTRRKRTKDVSNLVPSLDEVATVAGADPPTRSWRDRLDKANAQTRELELARLDGRSLDRATVQAGWIKQLTILRSRLSAIPNAFAGQITAPVERVRIENLLQREIHAALHEIAGSDPDA